MSIQRLPDWHQIEQPVVISLKTARHHLWGNVAVYLGLFIIELLGARWGHSQALRADAFNNLSGIFSTGLLMTGLFIASRTHDDDLFGAPIAPTEQQQLGPRIQQSRFRFETIFNLLAGTIMAAIGIDIIIKGVMTFATRTPFKNLSSIAGLAAASRDTFTDALTSLTTVLTILVTVKLHLQWFDNLISIGLGLYILNTGTKIFRESSLNLVDYFDPYLEGRYQRRIADLTSVRKVIFLKAHYDGNLIMLRATIVVPPRMTAIEITRLIETINQIMWQEFGVMETDVMITTSY